MHWRYNYTVIGGWWESLLHDECRRPVAVIIKKSEQRESCDRVRVSDLARITVSKVEFLL